MPIRFICPRHGIQDVRPCRECARERYRARGSSTARGYDWNWRRLAKTAIAQQPWRSYCGSTQDLTGDHRVPLKQGGSARTLDDVIVACRSCNSRRGDEH